MEWPKSGGTPEAAPKKKTPEEIRFDEWKQSLPNKSTKELEIDLEAVSGRLGGYQGALENEIENRKKQEALIAKLGSLLHDEWRAPRKKEDGTFEPRLKKTKDQVWAEKHGVSEVDIANTDYIDLPDDWKGENKISAEIAIGEVYKTIKNGQELDDEFVESASSIIHEKWLGRNASWAPAEQNKPYAELSDEEKEKDRVIVRKAIEIYKSGL